MNRKAPARQGATWDAREERQVFRDFANGIPIEQIARRQQRTRHAITQRLEKLGLMDRGGGRVDLVPDIAEKLNRHKQSLDLKTGGTASTGGPMETGGNDPDYSLAVFYQIHGMSKRLYTCLQRIGITDFRETLHRAPSELLAEKCFSARLLGELLRFQQIYLFNPHPATLERLAAIQSLRKSAGQMARHAHCLGTRGRDEAAALETLLGRLDAELDRLERNRSEEPAPEIWSRLTAEKLVGLIYLLARSCAPDSQHFEVIRARLGLGDEQLELAEIAEITHLHRDRVRWIQERVLNTIVYQLNMKTRGHARLLEQLARRIIAAREGDPAEVLFAFCASFLEDGVDWMVAALLYIACDFSRSFAEAARKARYHKTRLAEAFLGSYTEQLGRDTLTASLTARLEDAAAVTGSPIHNRLPHLDGQHRASEDDSLCRQGSFLSRKCNAQISYRTLEEHCFFLFLERAGEVVWYGDRAFAIPYEDGGFARRFYPSAALVTDEGKGVVIDIQTPLEMVRRRTLIKALRACDHLARQGLAFMLCTREGHTLTDLAGVAVAHEKRVALTTLIDERGVVSWYEVDRLCRELSLSEPELISLIVNEDLCLQKKPFRLSRLPEGTSFAPMLASGEAACPASA